MGGFSYPKRGWGGAGINEVLNHSVFEVWGEFLYGVICITLGKSFSVGHRLHCAVGLLGLLPGPPDWVPKPPLVILPTWGTKASIHACGPYQSLFLRLLPTGFSLSYPVVSLWVFWPKESWISTLRWLTWSPAVPPGPIHSCVLAPEIQYFLWVFTLAWIEENHYEDSALRVQVV